MSKEAWLKGLESLKEFWVGRYGDCENDAQRQQVKSDFAEALAKYYGGSKPTDKDILEEVKLEIEYFG